MNALNDNLFGRQDGSIMTKYDIAKQVYATTDLTQAQAAQAVQATFDSLAKVLLQSGRVELRGFGVFAIQPRAARKARNPRTGEEVVVPEHEAIAFKPSVLLKRELAAKQAKKAKAAKKAAKPVAAKATKTAKTAKKSK